MDEENQLRIDVGRALPAGPTCRAQPDLPTLPRPAIPEHLMLGRLAQSEQMREFFIQMWLQNPALAKQGGSKVQNLLSPVTVANAIGFTANMEGDEK